MSSFKTLARGMHMVLPDPEWCPGRQEIQPYATRFQIHAPTEEPVDMAMEVLALHR